MGSLIKRAWLVVMTWTGVGRLVVKWAGLVTLTWTELDWPVSEVGVACCHDLD